MGLPQGKRLSLGSSRDPCVAGEEPSLVGRNGAGGGTPEREPGVRWRDGDALVPPTQPTPEVRWHSLSLAVWLSIDALLKGGGQPVCLGVITGDPCSQADIAEVAVASFSPPPLATHPTTMKVQIIFS